MLCDKLSRDASFSCCISCSCCVFCAFAILHNEVINSHRDAGLITAFLLVRELWIVSNEVKHFLSVGGAVLQRAVLVNSVLY